MREKRAYGKHDLYIEDDILFSVPHGELNLSEMHIYTDFAAEVIARHGYCMLLSDTRDVVGIDAAARRYSAQWSIGKPVIGIAMFNASLTARTLFTLVLKAMNMIGKQLLPFTFHKTEQEARDWLALLRNQHLAKLAGEPKKPPPGGADPPGLTS